MNKNQVLLIITGGTILSEKNDPQTGTIPSLDIDAYLKKNIFLSAKVNLTIDRFSLIDSRQMTPSIWLDLAQHVEHRLQAKEYKGIIILHGTDTLEETAFFLSLVLSINKPVILTGAMRAADEYDTDGPRNILQAIEVICASRMQTGVMVVFNGHIYEPSYVFKTNTHLPNSFSSNRTGHLGVIENHQVKWFTNPKAYAKLPLPVQLPSIDLLYTYPGFSPLHLENAILQGAKGLVIAGYGCGNVHDNLAPAIELLLSKGIIIVMATRVKEGSVFPCYGGPGGSISLNQKGVIYYHDLSPFKARILLMVAFAAYGNDLARIQACFQPHDD